MIRGQVDYARLLDEPNTTRDANQISDRLRLFVWLQAVEECDELPLFRRVQVHLETLLVEVCGVREVRFGQLALSKAANNGSRPAVRR